MIYNSKKLIMHASLASEVNVLAHMLDAISATDRYARDFTRKSLRDVIRETIACFPVYRTYIDERGEMTERDRAYIHEAIARAKRRNPDKAPASFDFLRDILLLKHKNSEDQSDLYRNKLYFTLKFQQLTGPVMAKGMEDTACYVYNRFIAVNEVGGSPKQFGISVEEFHSGNLKRAESWPYSMLATSTHDTKRSEDVRARLDVLSEMPKTWAAHALALAPDQPPAQAHASGWPPGSGFQRRISSLPDIGRHVAIRAQFGRAARRIFRKNPAIHVQGRA